MICSATFLANQCEQEPALTRLSRPLGAVLVTAEVSLWLIAPARPVPSPPSLTTTLADWYSDTRLVAWAGVGVNLAVVIIALFLNVALERYRRPRLQVSSGEQAPWQVVTGTSEGSDLLHVRLRVQNSGRDYEEACEVRVEEVLCSSATSQEPAPLTDHDPRTLKWVGRTTKPISLSAGAFDFVDLGVRSKHSPEHVRLEFDERGHLDLWLRGTDCTAYLIVGTAYGRRARPRPFKFDISWNRDDFGTVRIRSTL